MPRKRQKDKHLPERVYLINGTYYFLEVPARKWHRLGKTLHEAMAAWTKFYEHTGNITTMKELFTRYMAEIAPKKSVRTYQNNQKEIKKLIYAFGNLVPRDITPVDIYEYMDARAAKSPTAANREKSLLSHVFTMAIRWGVIKQNPCFSVKRFSEKARDRYVTDEELLTIIRLAPSQIALIIEFAYLTGLRQSDILAIKNEAVTSQGIAVKISKNQNKILIQWSQKLKSLVESAQVNYKKYQSDYLFCNKKGKPYTADGFRTMWQKLMSHATGNNREGKMYISESFRFHDIRRKTATDIEEKHGREVARKLLGHDDQKTTAIYISGYEKVNPIE